MFEDRVCVDIVVMLFEVGIYKMSDSRQLAEFFHGMICFVHQEYGEG
jgi:hypothetical protein